MKFKVGDKVICYNETKELKAIGTIFQTPFRNDYYYVNFDRLSFPIVFSESSISLLIEPNKLLKEIL